MTSMIPLSAPDIGAEEKRAVLEVMDSGWLVQGPRTAALEQRFHECTGAAHAVAVSSGTAALHLALLAAGVGPGDEVLTTAFSFIATAEAIVQVGATPVFCDIEAGSFNLDPESVLSSITERTRAIVLVHLFGRACNMHRFRAIAEQHGLRLIEDCAQALGATWRGEPVGSQGIGAFSLYATKNVTSVEGGVVTTPNAEQAVRVRSLRQHGVQEPGVHGELGYNYRLSDVHAAIGLVQLGKLQQVTAARQANARVFDAELGAVVGTPEPAPEGSQHVYHHYTVRLPGASAAARDRAVTRLRELGVGAGVFYRLPMHHQPALRARGLGARVLPVAERAADEVIALPVHPLLSNDDRATIVRAVRSL